MLEICSKFIHHPMKNPPAIAWRRVLEGILREYCLDPRSSLPVDGVSGRAMSAGVPANGNGVG